MDREVAPDYIKTTRNRRWLFIALGIILTVTLLYFFRKSLGSTLESSRIRTGTVEKGNVENTLTASGEVIPAYEQIFTSPIRASIKRILLTPGTQVNPGEAIVELDKSLTVIESERYEDQLKLKQNSIEQLRMKLNKDLYDAEINDRIKSLNINKLRADFEDAKRLQKVGGGTAEDITRAENALKIAELEKKQLENDLKYNRESMGASLKETELGAQIESKNLKELQHKLRMADIVADRKGVLTWVNENIGSSVNEGEMLAKVADLGSFRVEGSCSDIYADQVKAGLSVIIRLNEVTLRGVITQVKPAVKDGVIGFVIQLDNAKSESLRPNMKVEVYVVTSSSSNTVRVANGPAFTGKKKQFVYVLKDNKALRREVETGLSNFDFVEIKSGLEVGEKVILTDLNDYEHLEEISIQ
ncbi:MULTISPECIES: efflux RND transporter periplasmic adaptor subunit [unclassified Dyadobacter]|uniref:efflux RND transporter periplasmic adaptor subunit n=1 Tax=unclassified Dyadobacter TaxID=2625061 RepID=UPI001F36DF08|nr:MULTISPECIES: efflux RND transporter periplasmic adaptor subunit [unclassified Dyadobacter]MCE7070152.1 efflux RND transporter periplasmic adaptor subunit [Dyadobacter sp. CY327]MCF2520527.1 efflux RND transporter periplasmic adaptor subunit [Dyadobacter sp. CY351]